MPDVFLHNTRTKKIEMLEPLKPDEVTLYSCGPTVYDHIHIGNLSAFIAADTLRRVLKAAGYQVNHTMNLTDVDDKTIRRSAERYPDDDPLVALGLLTREYENIFMNDLEKIGFDKSAVNFVRATDYIEGMQKLIRKLYGQGFAYIADDGVYFSIEKYQASGKKYGQLTNITADNTSQARITNDEYDKDFVHDFALWKLQKDEEPAWEFDLDGHNLYGRPGWHIECSVMSEENLGRPFDIHTGGIDLIFPHHENEIAQSTAGEDNYIYATIFVHNEHILVDGKKMSKSANNFYTLSDIIEKGFDPLAFRLLVLQSHYRSQTNFSWESLEAAQNRLGSLRAMADRLYQATENEKAVSKEALEQTQQRLEKTVIDDLSTPQSFAVLSQLETAINSEGIASGAQEDYAKFLHWLDDMFGLGFGSREDITDDQKKVIQEREEARRNQDWAKSDELRNVLKEQDIEVRDTSTGQIWSRV